MNLQEQGQFYDMMSRLKANSRAASTEEMITEVHDGLIVTRPLKQVEYLSEPAKVEQGQEAKVWNLTKDGPVLQSKAASVPGINKLKVIQDFIRSNGRI